MAIEPKKTARRRSAGSAKSISGPETKATAGYTTQSVAPALAQHPTSTAASTASGRELCGRTVNLSFYDAATLARLLPADGTQLELRTVDRNWSQSITLKENKATQLYSFSLPGNLPARAENKLEDAETLCGIPKTTDADLLELSSPKALAISCQSYSMPGIALVVHSAANEPAPPPPAGQGTTTDADAAFSGSMHSTNAIAPPCSIAVPLTRLEESYTVRFFAYDTCFKDYLLNAKALINDVEVTATPVNAQSNRVAARPRAAKITGRTVDGFVELPGLTPNQLYRLEVKGPSEYVCVKPPQPFLYHLLGRSVPIHAFFQPCGKFPARTVVFAQQGCLGLRVSNLNLQAGGQPISTDENGIWNVPAGTTGMIEFQSPGKVFSPASIEFREDTAMAIVVGVGDQTVGQFTHHGGRRFYFLDERGEPFKHRKLELRSHTGEESTVYTGPDGGFDAEDGWLASADEDASGHAVSAFPLLIGKI